MRDVFLARAARVAVPLATCGAGKPFFVGRSGNAATHHLSVGAVIMGVRMIGRPSPSGHQFCALAIDHTLIHASESAANGACQTQSDHISAARSVGAAAGNLMDTNVGVRDEVAPAKTA